MHLKSIEMHGFKSFPEHTCIDFHPGVTAIVGPNGSGKSNVTDAIRWVLGEQSAKSLRGGKMEDVIFNGTSSRRRMGLSEVSIAFDNNDKFFPLDFSTIVITRRYYRSGESEYLLNKTPCRLKDIVELFADTGIGRDGYSIISQGKVDEILSERSEDRRRIFDEAAGIVKFKMRKQEAQRKLERSDQNATRLNDILQELQLRLEPLVEQANKAKEFLAFENEQRNLDLGLTAIEVARLEQDQVNITAAAALLETELNSCSAQKLELRTVWEQKQEEQLANEAKIDELRCAGQQFQLLLAEIAEEAAQYRERIDNYQDQIKRFASDSEELNESIEQVKQSLSDRELHKQRLGNKREAFQLRLTTSEAEFKQLISALALKEECSEQQQKDLLVLRDEVFALRKNLLELQFTLKEQRQQCTGLSTRQELLQQEVLSTNATLTDYQQKDAVLRQDTASNLELSSQNKKALTALLSQIRQIEQEQSSLNQEVDKLNYLIQTLKQLDDSREGYHQAVRALTTAAKADASFAQGLHGPVGELLSVSKEFELALETCLGASLHNIVTTDKVSATRFISYLKEHRAGRETFLPLDQIEARYFSVGEQKQFASCPGYLGLVSEVVVCSEQHRLVADFLCARILLVDNLANALDLARVCGKKYRIVTKDGDMVHPGGSMSGGYSSNKVSGLLGRRREIEVALQRRNVASTKLTQLELELPELLLKLEQLQEIEAEYSAKANRLARELQQIESLVRQEQKHLNDLKLELNTVAEKSGVQEVEIEALQTQENEALTLLAQKTRLEEELLLVLAEERKSWQKDEEQRELLREEVASLRISLASLQETINGVDNMEAQLQSERTKLTERLERLVKENEEAKAALVEMAERTANFAQQKEQHLQEIQLLEGQINALLNLNHELKTTEMAQFEKVETIAARISLLSVEIERCQAQNLRLGEQIALEKNRLWESYQITIRQAAAFRAQIQDEAPARKRLKALKIALKDMGTINIKAPQEYEEVKQRFDFMGSQLREIEQSRLELNKVITDLESGMRQQFKTEFDKINLHFQETFSALFNGGHAELLPSEGDYLDCGIEIKAQPPGKRLQNLTLLSGGERTLTAIALLFAIFQLRPAPFCVLDEVESALDDANVLRFTAYVQNYVEKSQFILVTHRKGTMEAADRLYGVTMKERGVSQIISMELASAVQEKE